MDMGKYGQECESSVSKTPISGLLRAPSCPDPSLVPSYSEVCQQVFDVRHAIGGYLREDGLAIERNLKRPCGAEGILEHIESEVPSQQDDHAFVLEALVERVVVDGRDEVPTNPQYHQTRLHNAHHLRSCCLHRRKREFLPDHQDLRPEVPQSFLQLLKGITVGSALAELNQQHYSLAEMLSFWCREGRGRIIEVLWFGLMVMTCVIRSGRRSLLLGSRLLCGRPTTRFGDFLEDSHAYAEVDEAAEEEGKFVFPSHYIMGCEVTSAYNDEVTGKMGFTQPVVDDMLTRDFRKAAPMNEDQLRNKSAVHNIEGFTQSYASGRLFFAVIAEVECLVYTAGRYLVIEEVKSKKRKFICNKEMISALDVRDKLCLVGLGGGYLVLWDMEFLEIKVEVMLPEGSLHVTTVSVTSKYLFATDASQPNNFAYCFDLRTARLKSSSLIASMEPAIRSISVGEDTHVTSCADGVWFMQAGAIKDQLKVTRGMFGHNPKTSMACLAREGDYVISGGVDGYIYAWRITNLRCTKALKVHQSQISAMTVKNGQVVVACISGRVKIFSFKVAKNQKKTPGPKVDEQEGAVVEDDDEILTFVLMETYDKQGVIFTIAPSNKDPLLYYCQTREGLLFQKRLPVNDFIPSKKGLAPTVYIENITRLNGKAHAQLYQGKIYSIYLMSEKILFLDIHKIEKSSLILHQERLAKLQLSCAGKYLAYVPPFNEVAYLSKGNRVMVAETFNKHGDSLTNANQSNFGENSRDTLQIAQGEQLISLSFISFEGNTFLAATTSSSVHILHREGRLTYQEKYFAKYQKEIPSAIEVAGRKLVYESLCGKWRHQGEDWHGLQKEEVEWQEKLLCCKSKSTDTRWKNAGIIMGQGYAIFPK